MNEPRRDVDSQPKDQPQHDENEKKEEEQETTQHASLSNSD